jgi:hypothetical protein
MDHLILMLINLLDYKNVLKQAPKPARQRLLNIDVTNI